MCGMIFLSHGPGFHGTCVAFLTPIHLERKEIGRARLSPRKFVSPWPIQTWNKEPSTQMQMQAVHAANRNMLFSSSLTLVTQTWKYPRWYVHNLHCAAENPSNLETDSPHTHSEREKGQLQHPDGRPPRRVLALKLLCSVLLLGHVGLAWGLYYSFSNSARSRLDTLSTKVLGRPLRVGRLVRLLPSGGICMGKLELPQTPTLTTAPSVSARRSTLWVSGVWGAIFSGKELHVNVTLSDAVISVHQITRIGPKGKLMAQWDPGVPPSTKLVSDSSGSVNGERNGPRNISVLADKLDVQPGILRVEKATVFLHTAVLPDYGHGGEVVEVQDVCASASFPKISVDPLSSLTSAFPFLFNGNFGAHVQGAPVGGGVIDVSVNADAEQLLNLETGSEICKLHVRGEDILAPKIAAFLSLPFRVDTGVCQGDVTIDFLYGMQTLIPDMHGEAEVKKISLRFHPDPKTPEFVDLSGKLRFDRKDLFLDGTRGTLGSLPLTVVGNIDLVGNYNLAGYIPSVDVNNILETFDVEKFVPVTALVKGEARLTGPLEEPTITGWAETTSENTVFDRLPLSSATVDFEWEAIAGTLKFTDIRAKILGQGFCTGRGGLYFDMTKETPYGINRETHHENSPKASYWNPGSSSILHPLPEDEMEIDDHAPYRSYDSMRFDFEVEDVNGSDLLRYYGGKYGGMAALSVGTVEGKGVLAGHAKDANCRVTWRSVSPPPNVSYGQNEENLEMSMQQSTNTGLPDTLRADETQSETRSSPEENAMQMDTKSAEVQKNELTEQSSRSSSDVTVDFEEPQEPSGKGGDDEQSNLSAEQKSENKKSTLTEQMPLQVSPAGDSVNLFEPDGVLGGGDFQGLVYIKLGDLPAARRVKVRTTVKNFDARRLGWLDESLRSSLEQVPLLTSSLDTYFKGVMYQRPIIPPGSTEVPRTPRMELLGADGALAVRKLSINNVDFAEIMAGSFSFSTSDFSMSLKETLNQKSSNDNLGNGGELKPEFVEGPEAREEKPLRSPTFSLGDELTVSASLKGDGMLRLRQKKTEVVGSITTNKSNHRVVDVFSRHLSVQDLLGESLDTVSGIFNVDAHLNLDLKEGEGTISLKKPRLGPVKLSSVSTDFIWNGQELSVVNGLVRSRNSLLEVSGSAALPSRSGGDIVWEGNVDIAHASLGEIVEAYKSGLQVLQSWGPRQGRRASPFERPRGVSWVQRLSQISSSSDPESFTILEVPEGTLEEQVEWFDQYLAEEKLYGKSRDLFVSEDIANESLYKMGPEIVQGHVDGKIRLRYEQKPLQKKKAILVSRDISEETSPLHGLQDLSVDFEITGKNWVADDYSLSDAFLTGRLLNNTLSIGTLRCQGSEGFFAQANGYVRSDGGIKLHGDIEKAPAAFIAQYFQAPVIAGGDYSGHLDIAGNIKDPVGDGMLIWANATLNGKRLQEAQSEFKWENGRCTANVSARVGGKDAVKASDEVVRISAEVPMWSYWDRALRQSLPATLLDSLSVEDMRDIDEEILMVVDIRKFGLVFLNAVLPDLRWTSGSADVNMEIGGSFRLPIVKGRISFQGVKMWPRALRAPIESVTGEVLFDEVGTVSMKSVYGRCNGKGLHVRGDILLSEQHRASLDEVASHGHLKSSKQLESVLASDSKLARDAARALNERKSAASSLQEKVERGLTFEVGEIPINIEDVLEGTVSGKVVLKRALASPEISGYVGINKGTIFLSNTSSRVDTRKLARSELSNAKERMQTQRSLPSHRTVSNEGAESGSGYSPGASVVDSEDGGESLVEELSSRTSKLDLNEFRISFGRDMKIIYPFLLNLEAHGSLFISGPSHKLKPQGKIYFSQGQVNVLASRMDIKPGEESYARFDENSGDEPVVKIALENDDVVVRINEAVASKWTDHLEIRNKRGGERDESSWAQSLVSRLESGEGSLTAQSALLKMANSYVTQVGGTKGEIGGFQWRFHPTLGGMSGESSGNIAEDLGAGARLSYGRGSLSVRTALSGEKALAFELRPWKWLGLRVESTGHSTSVQIEMGLGRNRKDKETSMKDSDGEKGTTSSFEDEGAQ